MFCSSLSGNKLLVATACRMYYLYQLEARDGVLSFANLKAKESPLRHQTRCCCLAKDGKVVLGSVEGRISVEGPENYAFRAHKSEINSEDNSVLNYPVNAVQLYGDKFLLSCGSDGMVYAWDLELRKKIYKIQETYAVGQILVHNSYLVVCKSYNWENGSMGKVDEEIEIIVYDIREFGLQ